LHQFAPNCTYLRSNFFRGLTSPEPDLSNLITPNKAVINFMVFIAFSSLE
jgi:hypothetical protein